MTAATTTDRRKSSDRRSAGDRRRGADKRYVTLEVCPDELRLVLTVKPPGESKPFVVARTTPWRQDASSLLTAAGRKELARALIALSNEERLSGCDTSILLGGAYCVTRTASGATGAVDRQLRELEERGQHYLSLGVGQVSMAKRQYPLDARHMQGLLSVANQLTINCVAEAAHEAGLSLKRVESSVVSLCRAHRLLHPREDHPVLLVNLFEGGVTLGVADQGRLLLEYMPGGSPRPAETAEIVARHLSRIQRFCARQHVGQSAQIQHVYLCGNQEQIEQAAAGFRKL
ncbi:MAG: hypothetical protein KDA37_07395, partial [Planctomycetales bacterium]|nr:hypothetical protein [Planctomycetales bacterium]